MVKATFAILHVGLPIQSAEDLQQQQSIPSVRPSVQACRQPGFQQLPKRLSPGLLSRQG